MQKALHYLGTTGFQLWMNLQGIGLLEHYINVVAMVSKCVVSYKTVKFPR